MSASVPPDALRRGAGALAILVALAGCGAGAPQRPAGPSAAPAALAAGRRLFVREHCGACHTLAAAATRGRRGPDFDTSERLTRAQLRAALSEGANGMPSYAGHMTARQLDAVAAFLFAATHR